MYKAISLFSGAMGLDIGLESAGFETTVCVENHPACIATIKLNRPEINVLPDISQVSGNEILSTAKLDKKEVDLVVGGPPCQPFSTAGNRLSVTDPRGNLIYEFMRIVMEIQPRFFVMENVKGLLSAALKHATLEEREERMLQDDEMLGSAFHKIRLDFQKMGYKIIYSLVDAVYFGVPQFRERLVIIGSRDNEQIFIPQPTNFMTHQDPQHRWRTLGDAIRDLEDGPGPFTKFSKERTEYLERIPPGKNWRALPEEIKKKAMGGAYHAGGGKMGFYRRLSYEQPSPTLVTSPAQKATMLCHPTKTRPLSVLEYSRIQQFPHDWKFSGPINEQYMQIGNAVPVGLGNAIGGMLVSVIEDTHTIKTKRSRGTSLHQTSSKQEGKIRQDEVRQPHLEL